MPKPVRSASHRPAPNLPVRPRAAVVGAGIGGLALAIRLQAGGFDTTLIEARDRVGGLAAGWNDQGFSFDSGPSALADPAALADLWALSGHALTDDLDLLPIAPWCRFNWPDGAHFDYSGDAAAMAREIARIAPGDAEGFSRFAEWCAAAHDDIWLKLGRSAMGDLAALAAATPALVRQQAWRSPYATAARFVKSDKLREVLTAHLLEMGGNPYTASAVHLLHHQRLARQGLSYPKGGFAALSQALAKQFERIGGTLRLGDPVVRLHTLGNRIDEVECHSGWRERFAVVASDADLVHTYRRLLGEFPSGPATARKLAARRWSPGAFVLHFGLEGSWPGIPHQSVLFGPRFKGLFDDIHAHGVLPRDLLITLHHPSVTDPAMAPPGKSSFTAVVPVANRGKLPIDWEQLGPLLEERVLDEVGRRLIPDISDRIVCKAHVTPRDFALDLGSHLGSGYGPEPVFAQSGWLRPHNRDPKLANFYLVGAGTHPGATVPGVLAGARSSAMLMLENTK
jgi:phytoene desaturase